MWLKLAFPLSYHGACDGQSSCCSRCSSMLADETDRRVWYTAGVGVLALVFTILDSFRFVRCWLALPCPCRRLTGVCWARKKIHAFAVVVVAIYLSFHFDLSACCRAGDILCVGALSGLLTSEEAVSEILNWHLAHWTVSLGALRVFAVDGVGIECLLVSHNGIWPISALRLFAFLSLPCFVDWIRK